MTNYHVGPRHVVSITLLVVAVIALILFWGVWGAHGQQARPELAPKQPSQAQADHIDVAIKDEQITLQAEAQLQQQKIAQDQEVGRRVVDVRKELGLDDTWNYDFQLKKFIKAPKALSDTSSPSPAAPPALPASPSLPTRPAQGAHKK